MDKPIGSFIPDADLVQDLGRDADRFNIGHFKTLRNTLSVEVDDIAQAVSSVLPEMYQRSGPWSSTPLSLVPPVGIDVDVGNKIFRIRNSLSIDLAETNRWDDAQFAVASNRAGKDFYIYVYANGSAVSFILSNNSTIPAGAQYTAANTRKIGGFHCLCADVGTITGHPLSGMTAGQVLPASVWDLRHRPVAEPEGMVYCEAIAKWIQIYMADPTGVSVFNTAAQNRTSWLDVGDLLGSRNLSLPDYHEFRMAAKGSVPETAVFPGSYDGWITGGTVSTSGNRIISNIGIEDATGTVYQMIRTSLVSRPTGEAPSFDTPEGILTGYGAVQLGGGTATGQAGNVGRNYLNAYYDFVTMDAVTYFRGCCPSRH